MVDPFLRQSALAHLGLNSSAVDKRDVEKLGAGITLAERPHQGIVNLRGDTGDKGFMAAFEAAFEFALPVEPNTTAVKGNAVVLWLGPNEWWVITPGNSPTAGPKTAARLHQALAGQLCAVTDVSESRTCIRVAGPQARALLEKGCPLDFHPRNFDLGGCAQSHLAKAGVVFHQVVPGINKGTDNQPTYDLYVLRSFAEYLWRWLEDAAREYGMVVLKG